MCECVDYLKTLERCRRQKWQPIQHCCFCPVYRFSVVCDLCPTFFFAAIFNEFYLAQKILEIQRRNIVCVVVKWKDKNGHLAVDLLAVLIAIESPDLQDETTGFEAQSRHDVSR